MSVMAPDVALAATSGLLRAAGQIRATSDDLLTEDDGNYFRCEKRWRAALVNALAMARAHVQ